MISARETRGAPRRYRALVSRMLNAADRRAGFNLAVAFCSLSLVIVGCATAADVSSCLDAEGKGMPFRLPGKRLSSTPALMSVFKRERRPTDRVPPRLDRLLFDERARCDGCRLIPERSRLLLANGGARHRKIFAVPTREGGLCWQLTASDGESGCDPPGYFAVNVWDEGGPGRCEPVHVLGTVPDAVRTVDVVVNARRQPAQMGSNAFFYELRTPKSSLAAVSAVVFRLKNGRTFRVSLQF